MYLCILDQQGQILLHKNMKSCPDTFLAAVEPATLKRELARVKKEREFLEEAAAFFARESK